MITQADIDAMKASIKSGVAVVAAPQLFETPEWLADKMINMLDPDFDDYLLEPSAGTGRLLDALDRYCKRKWNEYAKSMAARGFEAQTPLSAFSVKHIDAVEIEPE